MGAEPPNAGDLSVRADYLRGDPAEAGPITRGRLELETDGLRFSVPGGPEMRIDLRSMEGLTVTGRSPYERPRRHARGTMLIAARRNGRTFDVWEFAVERKSGAVLQDRINRQLHARGLRRPPLPYVEQLVGPVPPPAEDAPEPINGHGANRSGPESNGSGNGHPAASGRLRPRGPRNLVLGLIGVGIAAAEVLAVVLLLG
jgi:hypothetical protein